MFYAIYRQLALVIIFYKTLGLSVISIYMYLSTKGLREEGNAFTIPYHVITKYFVHSIRGRIYYK